MERLRYGKDLHEAVYRPVRNNGKVFEIEYEGKIYKMPHSYAGSTTFLHIY